MTSDFGAAMRQALQFTRSQKLSEATALIQRALSGGPAAAPANDEPPASAPALEPPWLPTEEPAASARSAAQEGKPTAQARRPLGEVLTLLRDAGPAGLATVSAGAEAAESAKGPGGGRGGLPRPNLRQRRGFAAVRGLCA